MKAQRDFRELLVEADMEDILLKVEDYLRKNYVEDDDNPPVDVWEKGNILEVDNLGSFYRYLQDLEIIPGHLTLHISIENQDDTYKDMASRVILFDELLPVYVTWFDGVISRSGWQFRGLKKEGIKEIIKATLMYLRYKTASITK